MYKATYAFSSATVHHNRFIINNNNKKKKKDTLYLYCAFQDNPTHFTKGILFTLLQNNSINSETKSVIKYFSQPRFLDYLEVMPAT